jgi:hypothetical protein
MRTPQVHSSLSSARGKRPTPNGKRPTPSVFPQPPSSARFSPFFSPAESANSFGMAAKTLRKKPHPFPDEIRVQILRKSGGKPADLLGIRCEKHCG